MDLATATAGVMPALVAVLAEAAIDGAVCHGLDVQRATDMFLHTLAGTAELILKRGGDTLAVRREVGTPGESTVRGVAALERNNVRTAFMDAYHDVLTRLALPYTGEAVVVPTPGDISSMASGVVVVGGGAIGLATAYFLERAGRGGPRRRRRSNRRRGLLG